MLTITIPPDEYWDESEGQFVQQKGYTLQLEHSLLSVSKWESKWKKSFVSSTDKTPEETLDYVRCMSISSDIPSDVAKRLTNQHIKQINDYISDPMTATWFSEDKKGKQSREKVTSELIYYWMIAFNIPVQFEKWHLNRLLTLIRVCNIKNQPPKKMSKRDTINQYSALNAARRKQFNTKG